MFGADLKVWRGTDTTRYAAASALVAACGSTGARAITPEQVRAAAASIIIQYTNPRTRYSYLAGIRALLRTLIEEHGSNPKLVRAVPKVAFPSPRNTTATQDERDSIIAVAPDWLKVWLLLCSDLALRSGTAAKIGPKDYDPERREISFRTKFGTCQTLPVTDAIAALFEKCDASNPEPYAYQLRNRKGWKCAANTMRHNLHRILKELGINKQLTAHDLRRTTAVRTLEVTADIRVVQALLGHRHLSTTLYYLDHRNTPVDRAVLEMAKLNARKENS